MCSLRLFIVSGRAHGDSMEMWYQSIKSSVSPALLVIIWNGVMSLNQWQGCCWCCVTVWLMRSEWFDCAAEQPSVSLKVALIRAGALSGSRPCHLILKRFNLALRTMMPLTLHTHSRKHTLTHTHTRLALLSHRLLSPIRISC